MAYDEVSQLRGTTAQISNYKGYPAQFVQNTETGKMGVMQGDTVGNIKYLANEEQLTPLATKEELKPLAKDADVLKLIAQSLTPEQKAQVVKNFEGTFLPLEGGILKGDLHFTPTEQTSADIGYSFEDANGSLLALRGKNYSASPGAFELFARTDSVNSRSFIGKPTGELEWGFKPVETVDTFSMENPMPDGTAQSYIRYKNGLQIVWGGAIINGAITENKIVNFIVPFTQHMVVVISNDANVGAAHPAVVGWQSNTGFSVGTLYDGPYGIAYWIAVGKWL